MQRRFVMLAGAALLGVPCAGFAQSADGMVRIGLLYGDAPARDAEQELLIGLREQGLVEGRNLVIERRYGRGRLELVPVYARELAQMKLDAVISTCSQTTLLVQKLIGSSPRSTPIVMARVADPVGQKIIASLARPGSNITGLSTQAADIMPKMLDLFADLLPRPIKVAVFVDSSSKVHPPMWRALGAPAQQLGIELVRVEAGRRPGDVPLPAAFAAAVRAGAGAIFVLPDEPFFFSERTLIVGLAAKHRLPALYGVREYVENGGLMSYGESMRTSYRGIGSYIRKVVDGENPGDIPVTQPTRFELVINLRTAKDLGIDVPHALLIGADAVIR